MKRYRICLPEYMSNKHAAVVLRAGASSSFWFRVGRRILAVDFLPENWPQLVLVVFESEQEAVQRLKEMLKEGWSAERNELF